MIVYAVYGYTPYEGGDVLELYFDKETAKRAAMTYPKRGDRVYECYEVEQHEVKDACPV